MHFAVRFDFRNPPGSGTTAADRYEAALEMAEWADRLGALYVVLSEHHGSADEYLPSPIPMAAAMAARTERVRFSIAALVASFYDPIRLAEDLLVLDHLSRGRVDLVIGGGYVREEFELYGVPMKERPKRVEEVVATLKAAFGGAPFEHRGRTVQLTPGPYRDRGLKLMLGGSSEAVARRAARIADGFMPAVPEVWEFYRDEVQRLGRPDPGPPFIGDNRVVALSKDPESDWRRISPHFRHESDAYGAWQAQDDIASPFRTVGDDEELRTKGQYAVLTPRDYVAELQGEAFPFALLHPLCGGMPIDLAWESLRLFESEVLPAFRDSAG